MPTRGTLLRSLRAGAPPGLALLAACATPATHPPQLAEQPASCTDSIYVQLRRQHPDSLSERAAQRLQALDRECATAREQSRRGTSGMMGMGHGAGRWMGVGIAVVMAVAMIAAMW